MFRTVADLKRYLSQRSVTPEALAKQVDISNMTIRRLLQRSPATRLPEKYAVLLNHLVQRETEGPSFAGTVSPPGTDGFEKLLSDLERDARAIDDPEELENQTRAKLKDRGVGSALRGGVKTLLQTIRAKHSSVRLRLIALGALAYFVNPFDLVPDAMPGVGFIDDFAVISLALAALAKQSNRPSSLPKK